MYVRVRKLEHVDVKMISNTKQQQQQQHQNKIDFLFQFLNIIFFYKNLQNIIAKFHLEKTTTKKNPQKTKNNNNNNKKHTHKTVSYSYLVVLAYFIRCKFKFLSEYEDTVQETTGSRHEKRDLRGIRKRSDRDQLVTAHNPKMAVAIH